MEELTDEFDGFVVILFVAGLAEVGTFKRCPLWGIFILIEMAGSSTFRPCQERPERLSQERRR